MLQIAAMLIIAIIQAVKGRFALIYNRGCKYLLIISKAI